MQFVTCSLTNGCGTGKTAATINLHPTAYADRCSHNSKNDQTSKPPFTRSSDNIDKCRLICNTQAHGRHALE